VQDTAETSICPSFENADFSSCSKVRATEMFYGCEQTFFLDYSCITFHCAGTHCFALSRFRAEVEHVRREDTANGRMENFYLPAKIICFYTKYILLCLTTRLNVMSCVIKQEQTPLPESASELYRPSDRRLPAKLVPNFADRGCHVVSATNSYCRILGFRDRIRYFFFHVAPQLYSRG
jgi:hypothetical protein